MLLTKEFKMYRSMGYIVMTWLSLFYSGFNSLAQHANSKITDFSISAGMGSLFSGGGIMLEYQISFSDKIKLSPFISFGSNAISTNVPGSWLGMTSGANLNFGHIYSNGENLSWIAGINYGAQGVQADVPSNAPIHPSKFVGIHQHLLLGFAGIVGYKFTSAHGFTCLYYIGMCYVHNPISDNSNYYFIPGGGFGIGYKFGYYKKQK